MLVLLEGVHGALVEELALLRLGLEALLLFDRDVLLLVLLLVFFDLLLLALAHLALLVVTALHVLMEVREHFVQLVKLLLELDHLVALLVLLVLAFLHLVAGLLDGGDHLLGFDAGALHLDLLHLGLLFMRVQGILE